MLLDRAAFSYELAEVFRALDFFVQGHGITSRLAWDGLPTGRLLQSFLRARPSYLRPKATTSDRAS
jgi:hypothetical protein